MNTSDSKQKQKILSTPGIGKVLMDILLLHDDIGNREYPIEYYDRLIKELANSYKREIKTEEVTAQTRDLESLIMDIASGKEKPWRNMKDSKLKDNENS